MVRLIEGQVNSPGFDGILTRNIQSGAEARKATSELAVFFSPEHVRRYRFWTVTHKRDPLDR